ncbi:hypothetical protein, partial [Acinetobacter sp.]|uniref:hypothetical protein n=1 Tax=Acinetobacter sp. TaxID=472 RepID=UPI0026483566
HNKLKITVVIFNWLNILILILKQEKFGINPHKLYLNHKFLKETILELSYYHFKSFFQFTSKIREKLKDGCGKF